METQPLDPWADSNEKASCFDQTGCRARHLSQRTRWRSFVLRYARVSKKALVGRAVHQSSALLISQVTLLVGTAVTVTL